MSPNMVTYQLYQWLLIKKVTQYILLKGTEVLEECLQEVKFDSLSWYRLAHKLDTKWRAHNMSMSAQLRLAHEIRTLNGSMQVSRNGNRPDWKRGKMRISRKSRIPRWSTKLRLILDCCRTIGIFHVHFGRPWRSSYITSNMPPWHRWGEVLFRLISNQLTSSMK